MLTTIIEFSIKNKLIIGLCVFFLIGFGAYELNRLPIDAVPDITDNQVQVITVTPSLGAPDVERLITFPIEQANSNIPGLKEIRSFSRFGLSLITLVFEDEIDIYWARQQVTERLKIAENQIPDGIGAPELAPVTTGLGEIYQYVVRAKPGYENRFNELELRTIQDWVVRRQLLNVKGVADVSSFGGRLKQYEIAVDVNKLKSFNITINDVFSAIEKNNENTGGSYIEKKSTVLYIRSEGLIGSIDDIKNIVVKNTVDGTPLLINDVAEINIGHAPRFGAMTYNSEGEVTGAVVMMLKGDNSNRVIENVKERICQIEKTLPEGVVIEPFLDRTKMVNNAISTVTKNLLEGALIVIFVLVLFLGNIRAGLLVASVIPLAMLFAIIMMNAFGVSGNLMSLGALDFGLIVDGAVIIVEAVMHGIHNNKTNSILTFRQQEMDKTVSSTASKMMNSAVFGQVIILVVYVPIFALEGIEGKMFKPMAQTVAFALLGAFILSLTYIPMMSALLLNKTINHQKNFSDKMMDQFIHIHQTFLAKVLNFPKTVMLTAGILLLLSVFIFSRMGGEFIPEIPEGDFAVETRVLTGSNLHTTVESCLKASHILKSKFPEVIKVVGKIGSGEIPTDPMPMEAADLMIILKDKGEWISASTWDELAEKMHAALQELPGVTFGFQYPVAMRFNELMTGSKQDVVCKIFGENLDTLSRYSKILGEIAGSISGAESIYVEPIDGIPQVEIKYNRSAVAQFGLNISDINRVVNTAFAGQSTGQVFEDERRFDLVVRLKDEKRKNLDDIQNLLIPTLNGSQIPLYQVAEVSIKESINQIQRENAMRRIIVGFNIHNSDVQTVVNNLQKRVEQNMKLPSGYYITYGGSFENLVAAKKRLGIAVPVSLLFIFLLLYFAFKSIRQSLLIYTAIPLSAIGGIFFLFARGLPFSISAGVGFIALFGVAVLNGIVLLAEFNRLKKDGVMDPQKRVLQGTKSRLRPVLMTALVASLGFLPMALSHGAGAEVQRPLATVVIGGLLVATFLTLFVLPVLYIQFEKIKPMKIKTTSILLSFALTIGVIGNPTATAQHRITLQQAIDTALENNFSVKNERLKAEYQKKLIASSISIPQTNVVGEYGQLNSIYTDTKFTISQSINFPTVYTKQKALQNQEWKGSVLQIALKESELKRDVTMAYAFLVYLQQKEKLLNKNDSIYTTSLEKAKLRFSKGESNILEKASAETQRGQIAMQLNQLKNDLEIMQLQFRLLLNTPSIVLPSTDQLRLDLKDIAENTGAINHPSLLILEQQKKLASVNTQLEKSKLLPDLTFGYTNMSIQGTGADNVYYPRSTRFNAFQLGLGVPLFFGSQKAKIKSSKTLQLYHEKSYEMALQNYNAEIEAAKKQYQTDLDNVKYFEEQALENAEIISKTANQQFLNGEINYLEWTMLINNAVNIENDYLNALKNLNFASANLTFLLSK